MWGVNMIIVKLTVLSFVLTAIMVWIVKVWASANPSKAMVATITKEYPNWMTLPIALLVIFDVVGSVLSVIWFLFFM